MANIFRLAGKGLGLGSQILRHDRSGLLQFVRPVTLKSCKYVPPPCESHDERNMRLGRPQSPHLTIYKPQLTAILSISHRATGMILSSYVVAFGLAAVYLECPIEYYIEEIQCAEIGAGPLMGLKFMLAFPLVYHFWNGIRHLLWDTGKFLTIRDVYITGYVMLAATIASAIALAAC